MQLRTERQTLGYQGAPWCLAFGVYETVYRVRLHVACSGLGCVTFFAFFICIPGYIHTYIVRSLQDHPPPRVIGYCDRSGPSHVSGINNLALEEEWSTHESGAGHRERSRRRLYYGTRTGIDYQRSASHLQGASGSSVRGPACNTTFQKYSCITAV